MAHSSLRKPLALAAVLATSVGAVLATSVSANATTYGDTGSPLTITANGVINVVGGSTVGLPAGARDVSWSGTGGRFAFIGADNAIYTADYDGSHIIKVAQGVNPSHTVWNAASTAVMWTEGTGVSATIKGALANGNGANYTFSPIQNPPAGVGLSNADVAADNALSMVVQTNAANNVTGVAVASWNASGGQNFDEITGAAGGWSPTISPDGNTVVFVKYAGAAYADQLFAVTRVNNTWGTPQQITWSEGVVSAPIFEAGMKNVPATVAYEYQPSGAATAPAGTYQLDVNAAVAAGQAAGLETKVSDLTGGLAVRTDSKAAVVRFPGSDRVDTAIKASQFDFKTAADATDKRTQAGAVVLSRSDDFADALGGSVLAAKNNAPLLLTETASLNGATQAEIQRVLPAGGTVYVLGGEFALSKAVADQLAALHYNVQRISGADRFQTAVNIANAVDPNPRNILVATGADFPDALSAGAFAGAISSSVIVLTDGTQLPAVTDGYLQAKAPGAKYTAAIGGPADTALRNAGWNGYDNSMKGADRYETSYKVAANLSDFEAVGVATGTNWPDALSGGALLGRYRGPLLLVDPSLGLTAADNQLIDTNRGAGEIGFVFGGQFALPTTVDDQLAADVRTATGNVYDNGTTTQFNAVTPKVTKS